MALGYDFVKENKSFPGENVVALDWLSLYPQKESAATLEIVGINDTSSDVLLLWGSLFSGKSFGDVLGQLLLSSLVCDNIWS